MRQSFARLALLAALSAAWPGFSGVAHAKDLRDCLHGRACTLNGRLTIQGYSDGGQTAWIDTDRGCVALALSSEVIDHREAWNAATVIVDGEVSGQPALPGLMWYSLQDRRVTAGVCGGGFVMYVNRISRSIAR